MVDSVSSSLKTYVGSDLKIRRNKLMKKRDIIIFIFALGVSLISIKDAKAQVKIDVNIIRGEQFFTPKIDKSDLIQAMKDILSKKGYSFTDSLLTEDQLIIEAYLYQYPGQFPTIIVLGRTNTGVHYIEKDHKSLFITQKSAFMDLLDRIMINVPNSINKDLFYNVTIGNLVYDNNYSLISLSSKLIASQKIKNNKTNFEIDESKLECAFFADFDSYLKQITNLTYMKKKLGSGKIEINVRAKSSGKLEIINIKSPYKLKTKHESQMKDLIDAIPIIQRIKSQEEFIITVSN